LILSSRDIRSLIKSGNILVEPLGEDTIRENGLDLRFSGEVATPRYLDSVFIPGESDPSDFYTVENVDEYIIRRGGFALISTMEYIRLPSNIVGLIGIRSSYARLGIYTAPTVVDAGYEGTLTIALFSYANNILLRRGDRIIHLTLWRTSSSSDSPYSGIYKGVRGVALPFFRRPR